MKQLFIVTAFLIVLVFTGCGTKKDAVSADNDVTNKDTFFNDETNEGVDDDAVDGDLSDDTDVDTDVEDTLIHDCISEAKINEAVKFIESRNYIDSFIVTYKNKPVTEKYYNSFTGEKLHEIQSATKTFTAVLTGIAIDEGIIESVDQKISELLPAYQDMLTDDKSDITVKHLLTMTSGLKWTDFGSGNSFEKIAQAEDSVAFILGEPLVTNPGEKFFYNTGSPHLLSAIIKLNSGMSTEKFAEKHLFEPLEISEYDWPVLQDGINQGGWGMYMKPGDFLKLGQLILQKGIWDDTEIVSSTFVKEMTEFQVSNGRGGGYGYQMWLDYNLFNAEDIAGARGYGGQDCLVIPSLDLVVVFTGNIYYPSQMHTDVIKIMNSYVLPSHCEYENP